MARTSVNLLEQIECRLIGLPIVFGYIVAAQFFRLMIDLAHSSRGTYEILKARSGGGVRVPPSPGR